jgi:uncharacterized protein (TIGR03437 family)
MAFRTLVFAAMGLAIGLTAFAQTGPALSVDASANHHAISPDIYGINFYWDLGATGDPNAAAYTAAAPGVRPTLRRWGGNSTSTYHWKFDIDDLDNDWFYEVLPDTTEDASKLPAGSSFNSFADQAHSTGGKILGTVPILGWLPKARVQACSFNVAKYPNQCKIDPYAQYHPVTCGDGVAYDPACGDASVNDGKFPSNPVYIKNNPNDVYAKFEPSFQGEWIQYLISRYGKASQGGVAIWALDNEPIWWDSTHRDIHPNPYTYDEVYNLDLQYAQAIKQADPTALVSGPVADNWASLWFSKKDIVAGWNNNGNYWSSPVDRNAHGGVAFFAWYLQQFRNYEAKHGQRLLDYLDLHAYYAPSTVQNASTQTAAINALRLESTREFWDPAYVVSGDYWIRDVSNNGAPIAPQLIPRLRTIVSQNYPGTKIAITEYNWTALDTLNGALAQADLLGIFGREQLDAATLWGPPKPTDPGAFAFKMYRNYDGNGGAFGETSIQASSADQSKLAVYAALRSDQNLTLMVINKTGSNLSSTLSLENFSAGPKAKVWRYSGAKLSAIVAEPDIPAGASLSTVFPANSITLLAIPPASNSGMQPTVSAVLNAASFGKTIAPGQMVVIRGAHLGPAGMAPQTLDGNGMLSTTLEGVRVLFNGIPGAIVYVSAAECSAVAPYFGLSTGKTQVQVEYEDVRSEPFEVAAAATAPGLFTADSSGKGQGVILNDDGSTRNSSSEPAALGSAVILRATGEGQTDPPGVDGRVLADILPQPLAAVSVNIGGFPATIEYAHAATGPTPGLFEIRARMSPSVQPGNQVPVHITIGGETSQDGVTLAVR